MTPVDRINPPKYGVLLLNMGGPDALETVEPFLYNLFSDPDIIRLPASFLFQKPLAWLIVKSRGKEARHNYAQMGGFSPQLPLTRNQAEALKDRLQLEGYTDLPVAIAMRYWHPFTEEAVDQLLAEGVTHLAVVSLYPHFSYTTTGSSLNELHRVLARKGNPFEIKIIEPYWDAPDYQAALAGCIEEGLLNASWTCKPSDVQILFSAHSLPVSHVKRTKDPYPEQIQACAKQVMETHFPNNRWDLAFQSKVGRMPWLGPDVEGVLHYYAGKHQDNILMVPISFVSDHVETLVEIDQQYITLANKLGIQQIARAPVMNTRPGFIRLLADMAKEAFASFASCMPLVPDASATPPIAPPEASGMR